MIRLITLAILLFSSIGAYALKVDTRDGLYTISIDTEKSRYFKEHKYWQFINLSPYTKINGIVHTGNNDKEYVTQIYREILKIAHKKSFELFVDGHQKEYVTFLIAALQVPFHESRLMHFRISNPSQKVEGLKNCNSYTNSGKRLFFKKKQKNLIRNPNAKFKLFSDFFHNEWEPLAIPCKEIWKKDSTIQLLANGLLEDMTIMQLSFYSHKQFYYDHGFLDTSKTIQYGIDYLYSSYKKLVQNYKDYPCLVKGDGTLDQYNLVRAIWGGKYNSGKDRVSKSCRFERQDSYSTNDLDFESSLKKFILKKEGTYYQHLEGEELNSLNTLVEEFKKNSFKKYQIKKFINIRRDKKIINPKVNGKKVSGRCKVISKLGEGVNNCCGEVAKNSEVYIKEIDKRGWARVLTASILKSLEETNNPYCSLNTKKGAYYQKRYYIKINNGMELIDTNKKKYFEFPQIFSGLLTEDEDLYKKRKYSEYIVTPTDGKLNIRERAGLKLESGERGPVCGTIVDPKKIHPFEIHSIAKAENGKDWLEIKIQKDSKWMKRNSHQLCKNAESFFIYKRMTRPLTGITVIPKLFKGSKVKNTYLRPNTYSKNRREKLVKDKQYSVYETIGKWYRITNPKDKSQRWVHNSYVTTVEEDFYSKQHKAEEEKQYKKDVNFIDKILSEEFPFTEVQ